MAITDLTKNYDPFYRPSEELPGPRIKETPWQPEARDYITSLYKNNISYPTLQIPGMTDTQKAGQSTLADIAAGRAYNDPSTSALYKGLRDQMAAEEARGLNTIRNQSQQAGMLRSSGGLMAGARYSADMGNKRSALLGELTDKEITRDNPYTRLAAVSQYGDKPREVQTQQNAAEWQKQLSDLLAPYQLRQPAAESILGYMPWQQPQFVQQPSDADNLASMVSMIMGVVSPFLAAKGGGGGGGSSGGFTGGLNLGPFSVGYG